MTALGSLHVIEFLSYKISLRASNFQTFRGEHRPDPARGMLRSFANFQMYNPHLEIHPYAYDYLLFVQLLDLGVGLHFLAPSHVIMRSAKTEMEHVTGIQCNAFLQPYFTLMRTLTAVRRIPLQVKIILC